jgi:hypothetical protein
MLDSIDTFRSLQLSQFTLSSKSPTKRTLANCEHSSTVSVTINSIQYSAHYRVLFGIVKYDSHSYIMLLDNIHIVSFFANFFLFLWYWELNSGALAFRQVLYHLSHAPSPLCKFLMSVFILPALYG